MACSAAIEGGAHGVRAPELDVVGVVVRLFQHALALSVPEPDAVRDRLLHAGPELAQPVDVAADQELAVHLQDAAELPVRRGVEVVARRADGQRGAEVLVARFVLGVEKLRFAHAALEAREQVAERLRVVPHVRAAAVARADAVAAALPAPEPPVPLAQDRRGFQDAQVGADRFHNDLGQRARVKGFGECGRRPAQPVVCGGGKGGDRLDAVELCGVPRAVPLQPGCLCVGQGGHILRVPDAQPRLRHVPRAADDDRLFPPAPDGTPARATRRGRGGRCAPGGAPSRTSPPECRSTAWSARRTSRRGTAPC